MKKNKIMSGVMAVLMLSSLSACSSKDDTADATTTTKAETTLATNAGTAANTEAQTASKDDIVEMDTTPITFTLYTADSSVDMNFNDAVAKKITEITGVTLEISHPVGGNDDQDIALMLASGTLPDMIFAKGSTGTLIDSEAIIPLDDYIADYGANLKALYGDQIKRLRYANDGKIYTLGTNGVSTAAWNVDGTFQIQHAVLKDQGYPTIKTLDDYEKAIKDYAAKYPQINGYDTIPLSLCGGSRLQWLVTVGNKAGFVLGYPDDGEFLVDDTTGEATYKWVHPGFKDYFKWLNRLYNEGVIDPESFTQKYDQYLAKLSKGNVISIADAWWDYASAETAIKGAEMYDRTYCPMPVTMSEDIVAPYLMDLGFNGGWGIGITENCKDPQRAFQFLDWWCSDEAQILANWGIEGVNYEYDANGKRYIPADELEKKNTDQNYSITTGVGAYVYPFPMRGDGAKDSTGNYYTTTNPDELIAKYTDVEKETLAAYGATMFADLFPQRETLPIIRHGQVYNYDIPSDSEAGILQTNFETYVRAEVTKAIIAPIDEFDAKWDSIVAWYEANGVDRLNVLISDMVKQRINDWYGE